MQRKKRGAPPGYIVLKSGDFPAGLVALKTTAIEGVPESLLLFEFGTFQCEYGPVIVDEAGLDNLLAVANAQGNDIVFDYEHQTLWDVEAPAAGWIPLSGMEKTADGLLVKVEWNDRAKEYLKNREYRYFSPVFKTDGANRVVELHSVALTNKPATYNQEPLVAKNGHSGKGEEGMDAKAVLLLVLKALGVDMDLETAKEDQVMEQVTTALKAKETPEIPAELVEALALKDKTLSEAVATVHALKQGAGNTDRLAQMEARLAQREAEDAVALALTAGKVTPAQKDWALKYATADLAGFKSFVEKAPVVVPLKGISPEGNQGSGGTAPEVAAVDAWFENESAEVEKVEV